MPFDIALNLELLACFGLTLTGMYLLLKQWRLPIAARMMGAITFSFGGPLLQRYVHLNALGVISHIPWLLLCIDLLCRSTSRRSVLAARGGIALLTGSQLLLGHPQYVFITLIAEGLYLGVLLALGPFRARPLVEYVGAKLVGLMLGCAQLLPSTEAVSNSTRSARDTESVLERNADYSLHPLNFLQMISPYGLEGRVIPDRAPALYMWESTPRTDEPLRLYRIWQELSTYVGLTPILLTLALMVHACDKRHAKRFPPRLKWYCLVLAAVGGGLALGRYSPLFTTLMKIPGLNFFRVSARYTILVALGLSIASAVALARLSLDLSRGRKWTGWTVIIPVATVAVLQSAGVAIKLFGSADGFAQFISSWRLLLVSATVALLVGCLFVFSCKGKLAALLLLMVAHVIDISAFGFSYIWTSELFTPNHEQLVHERGPSQDWPGPRLLVSEKTSRFNYPLLRGYRLANGYAGLVPRKRLDYRRPEVQLAASVSHVLHSWDSPPIPVSKLPLPEVRLVPKAQYSDNPARDLQNIDLLTTALVEQPLSISSEATGIARIVSRNNTSLVVETESDHRQLLVVATSYHAGWKATVDAGSTDVFAVNADFLGTVVPAGSHVVHFSWLPASRRLGNLISLGGLGLLVLGTVLPIWTARHRGP